MTKSLDERISTPWLVFNIAGQWCLLGLLVTFHFAKHLPQRNNPFLINFIFTAFLATIPPSLLVYSNRMHGRASDGLCSAQVALMNGSAPMFGISHVVLVFDTWSELRSICLHKSHFSRKSLTKYMLISMSYVAMWIWTIASLLAVFSSQAARYDGFAYCVRSAPAIDRISNAVGWFMYIVGVLGLIFEFWVCWMIYRYPTRVQTDPLVWRTNIQFALRVLLYSFLLTIAVALSLVNNLFKIHSPNVKAAYQLFTSMNPLTAFLVFGTQKSILRVWRFWDRKRVPNNTNELEIQPQSYPVMDWADIPARRPTPFNGGYFDHEEKGRSGPKS